MSDLDQNPGCLGALLRLLGIGPSSGVSSSATAADAFPYRLRDDFLSPAELSFYLVLNSVVTGQAVVCPKIGLDDLFFVPRSTENRAARNRIDRKHVDFVLCDPATMRPVVALELDDSSHGRDDRKERDAFVDQVFAAAQLPLIRIPAQRGYAPADLRARLAPYLNRGLLAETAHAAPVVAVVTPPAPMPVQRPVAVTPPDRAASPVCPKCGLPMVVRKSTQGERRGQEFYGCSNYPRCRETLPRG